MSDKINNRLNMYSKEYTLLQMTLTLISCLIRYLLSSLVFRLIKIQKFKFELFCCRYSQFRKYYKIFCTIILKFIY